MGFAQIEFPKHCCTPDSHQSVVIQLTGDVFLLSDQTLKVDFLSLSFFHLRPISTEVANYIELMNFQDFFGDTRKFASTKAT